MFLTPSCLPLTHTHPQAKGSEAYREFALELARRLEAREGAEEELKVRVGSMPLLRPLEYPPGRIAAHRQSSAVLLLTWTHLMHPPTTRPPARTRRSFATRSSSFSIWNRYTSGAPLLSDRSESAEVTGPQQRAARESQTHCKRLPTGSSAMHLKRVAKRAVLICFQPVCVCVRALLCVFHSLYVFWRLWRCSDQEGNEPIQFHLEDLSD